MEEFDSENAFPELNPSKVRHSSESSLDAAEKRAAGAFWKAFSPRECWESHPQFTHEEEKKPPTRLSRTEWSSKQMAENARNT